jgi:hypothetical protein
VNHLTPDELIDAAEDVLDAERHRHLDTCELCGKEVDVLRALLREATGVKIPEPSPLFWDHFSARVRQAVAEERSPAVGWSRRFGWSTLAPVGALAAVLIAMVATVARGPVPAAPDTSVVEASPDAVVDVWLEDEDWAVVADLLGPVDWDTAGEAGLALVPGDTELAVLSLSEDEQRELSRLLAGEIERSKS